MNASQNLSEVDAKISNPKVEKDLLTYGQVEDQAIPKWTLRMTTKITVVSSV